MVDSAENLAEILEAALSEFEEGIAVLDSESRVVFWNPAAVAITGHLSPDLLSRHIPPGFYQIDPQHHAAHEAGHLPKDYRGSGADPVQSLAEKPVLVNLHHKQGHSLPAMLRRTPLRDELGKRFGTLMRFHPVEEIDTLPHGAIDVNSESGRRVEESQADMEDRLDEAWQELSKDQIPFGLLWIKVDQAEMLRKTHGADASEAMLAIIERTLLHALRPSEIMGRWGSHEFLVLCHERTAAMLEKHAHHVGSLARTSDFRWWGDRISLTVSVGAAQAAESESLHCLLKRAQKGMQESSYAGGNHVVLKAFEGGPECSQS